MKKQIKKLLFILAAAAMGASAVALVGCDGDSDKPSTVPTERSELVGGFESTESRDIVLTNNRALIGTENENHIPYVYTSDIYPLNTITSEGLKYNTYQKLRLKRDWTYEYNLEILVRMVTVQSNIDLLKLEATTYGTFEYKDNSSDNYTVTLSDPTSGTESRYGSFITGEGNIFSWKLSTSPNYSLDVASVADSEEAQFDKYIGGKTVAVEKYEAERILYNSVFYTDFVDDLAQYCSYDSAAVPAKPVKPDPKPEQPTDDPVFAPDLRDQAILPYSAVVDGVSFAVSVGAQTSVLIKTPSTVNTVTFGDASLDRYQTDGDCHIFDHTVALSDLDKSVSVTAGDVKCAFKPTDYLVGVASGAEKEPEAATARYLAANLVNTCSVYNSAQVSPEIAAYVFNADDAYWGGGNWPRRDNTDNLGGSNEQGFEWVNPADPTSGGLKIPFLTIGDDVGELTYAFAVSSAYSDLSVKVAIGNDEYATVAATPAADQPLDEKTVYTFKVRASSPLAYDNVIKAAVYNGSKQISYTSGYSVTRALIRIIGHNDTAAGVEKARALWSLGMAATAYGYRNDIQYTESAPINADGRYEFSIGEYTYNIVGEAEQTVEVSGAALYIDGKIISDSTPTVDGQTTVVGDGYTVVRDEQNNFTVTLDGAHIKGLYTTNGASLTVVLKSDSHIDMPVRAEYTHWIDWGTGGMTVTEYDYGALVTRCGLTVKTDGEATAKLLLNGGLSAIGATVIIERGASVEAKMQSADRWDGVACASLIVSEGGALSVKYTGAAINYQHDSGMTNKYAVNATEQLDISGELTAEWSGNAITSPIINVLEGGALELLRVGAELKDTNGIVTAGSPVFAGNVTIKGFDSGILLSDDTAEQTLTVSGGKLDITAVTYGINTRNVDDGELYLCRELYFMGGVANIRVGDKGVAAVTTANITVGAGEVNLEAKHGVGVESRSIGEWWEGIGWYSRTTKIKIATVSGDHRVGKLSVSALDGSAALAVTELSLNGGNVYLYSLNSDGVLHTQANAVITVANADLIIENGKLLDISVDSYGRGIKAESGGEVIYVANSGKLIFKNVQVAIASWGSQTALDNDGLIILDGYMLGLEQWQVNSWQLQITVGGDGQIRQYNQI